MKPSVSVVLLAFGDEPYLQECVSAILNSEKVDIELMIVDNGSSEVSKIAPDPRITFIDPGNNTGFANGCNIGASRATSEFLVFVNSDLIVDRNAIFQLSEALQDSSIGAVTGAVLLADQKEFLNSAGNPIHYLMFSWSGSLGEPFEDHKITREVAGISGALFSVSRRVWELAGGFNAAYFAYNEDVDISLRIRQQGLKIIYEPKAIGFHYYEFTRNPDKWFLLERNRLMNFFTLYELRSILLLLPMFLPVEFGVFLASIKSGWWREKIRSWMWIIRRSKILLRSNRENAQRRDQSSANWVLCFDQVIEIPEMFEMNVPSIVNRVLGQYWRLVQNQIE